MAKHMFRRFTIASFNLFLLFSTINSAFDETFRHFSWNKNLLEHQKKPWMAYLSKMIEISLTSERVSNIKRMMSEIFQSTNKFITPRVKCINYNYYDENNNNTIVLNLPVGILRLHSFKKNYPCLPLFIYKCCSDVYYNYYQWTFEKLYNLLRMNFTFSEFNIKDLSRSCRKGNTSVSDFGTRSKHFTLCGKHAQFLYYSSKPKVTISTQFQVGIVVEISLNFSAMTRNTISTVAFNPRGINFLSISYIHSLQKMITSFHIKVPKRFKVCLFCGSNLQDSYVFIDGPSFLCKAVTLKRNETIQYVCF